MANSADHEETILAVSFESLLFSHVSVLVCMAERISRTRLKAFMWDVSLVPMTRLNKTGCTISVYDFNFLLYFQGIAALICFFFIYCFRGNRKNSRTSI